LAEIGVSNESVRNALTENRGAIEDLVEAEEAAYEALIANT
jgi:hypothetical protein